MSTSLGFAMPPQHEDEYRATPRLAASTTDCTIFQAVGGAALAGESLKETPAHDEVVELCDLDFPTCARICSIDWTHLVEEISRRASSPAPGHPKSAGGKSGGTNLVDGSALPVGANSLSLDHVVRSSDSDLYHGCIASERGVLVDGVVAHDVDLKRVDPREPLGVEPVER